MIREAYKEKPAFKLNLLLKKRFQIRTFIQSRDGNNDSQKGILLYSTRTDWLQLDWLWGWFCFDERTNRTLTTIFEWLQYFEKAML